MTTFPLKSLSLMVTKREYGTLGGSQKECSEYSLARSAHQFLVTGMTSVTTVTSLLPQECPSGTLLGAHKLLVGVITNYDLQFTRG